MVPIRIVDSSNAMKSNGQSLSQLLLMIIEHSAQGSCRGAAAIIVCNKISVDVHRFRSLTGHCQWVVTMTENTGCRSGLLFLLLLRMMVIGGQLLVLVMLMTEVVTVTLALMVVEMLRLLVDSEGLLVKVVDQMSMMIMLMLLVLLVGMVEIESLVLIWILI